MPTDPAELGGGPQATGTDTLPAETVLDELELERVLSAREANAGRIAVVMFCLGFITGVALGIGVFILWIISNG